MRRDKGLTLIELIVSLGLLMVISFSVTLMLKPIMGTYHLDMSSHSVMDIRNTVSNQISKELRISNTLQVYEYSEERVSNSYNCIYTNDDGYIMIKRNGKQPELLYPENFYGSYTVDLYFQILENLSSLVLKIDIYDKDLKLLDDSETGIELININEDSVVFESSDRQVVVYE